MNVRQIPSDYSIDQYNAVATHPLQSWQWGEARKKMGIDVIRLGEFDNDKLHNVYQLTFHPIPKTNFKIGYLPRSVFPSKEVLKFLDDYGKTHNIIFFKIEPNVQKKDFKGNITDVVKSPHPLFPAWTQVLDLTKPEEELLANMKSKTRYNIRLAEKKGVTVKEESNEEGFKKFSKLYFETTDRQKYYGHTPKYHQIIWDTLKDSMAHILLVYYNNTPLGSYELFYFNKTFYYPYGGSSNEYRNVMAPNLLMWEAIKLGKKLGATSFDMWGSLAPDYDQNDPWAGFTRFKEGYGAEFVEMIGSYDLVINPVLYKIYNILHKIREIILKLKR